MTLPGPLIAGLQAGLATLAVILPIVLFWRSRTPSRASEAKWLIVRKHTLYLPLPYDQAFARCLAAVGAFRGAKTRVQDRTQGEIFAITRWNLFGSSGEFIAFHLRPMDAQTTEVEVVCRPIVRVAYMDRGRNQNNLDKVTAFLFGDKERER